MEKDFDDWNATKKKIHNQQNRPRFREREIWFCRAGINIGFEEDDSGDKFLRPFVVLKKFNESMFFGIPLTRTPRYGKHYFTVADEHGISFGMLAQARVMDAKRLHYRSRIMPDTVFEELSNKFQMAIKKK
jgi:mRNA interferase MazF